VVDDAAVRVVWIGLGHVRQRPDAGVLSRNEAMVNILALASDLEGFRDAAAGSLRDLGLDLIELSDAEPLWERQLEHEVLESLVALAEDVRQTGRTSFGDFHTWPS
jgi:hypothetical protein